MERKKQHYPDWDCPKCKFQNFGSRSACRCGCFRPPLHVINAAVVGKSVDWNCDCGEMNFASRFACRKCNKERSSNISISTSIPTSSANGRAGDWNCDRGEMNFASRSVCRGCNKSKSKPNNGSTSNGRAGDWNCDCEEMDFASRSICRKCNNSKPINS